MRSVILLLCSLMYMTYSVAEKSWANAAKAKRSDNIANDKENIIILTASQLGWDDISLHGNPLAITPNMDTFARHGVTLNNHYINTWEFSTKVELITGKYASRLGLQRGGIKNSQPVSLPNDEETLPKVLKKQGYKNYYIGNWGLGFYKKSSLPTNQGFDSFFGSISFQQTDYYKFNSSDGNYTGYDLYNNTEIVNNSRGLYSPTLMTDVATDVIYQAAKSPHQPFFLFLSLQLPRSHSENSTKMVPDNWLQYFDGVYEEYAKKTHAAMVMALDVSLGRIMDALAASSILDNSVVLFLSDSSSIACDSSDQAGCNYPLRGGRGTVWEGGIRSSALFYSSKIKKPGKIIDDMIHVTDWFPTLASVAKVDSSTLGSINGVNILSTLTDNKNTKRTYIFHNFDTSYGEVTAFRVHEYKLIIGQKIDSNSGWTQGRKISQTQKDALLNPGFRPNIEITKNYSSIVLCDSGYPHPLLNIHAPPCKPQVEPCLYNLNWDPCEYHNLASFMERTVEFMLSKLNEIKRSNFVKKAFFPNSSEMANPMRYNGTWRWWIDESTIDTNFTSNVTNNTIFVWDSIKNTTNVTVQREHQAQSLLLNNQTNSTKSFEDTLERKKNETKTDENVILAILEDKNVKNRYKDIQPDQIKENTTDVENLWKFEHSTVNLNHLLEFKDLNEKKKNVTKHNIPSAINNTENSNKSVFENKSTSVYESAVNNTDQEFGNKSIAFQNDSKDMPGFTDRTEILDIFETPEDSHMNQFIINNDVNNTDRNPEADPNTKREKLPENTIDYKIAKSRGKTTIKNADEKTTNAYLMTKAMAGGEYDQKSNSYDGNTLLTSIEDEKLKFLSGKEITTKVYSLNRDTDPKNDSIGDNKNSTVEELFIDWDLLSKQSSFITSPPLQEEQQPTFQVPSNLVTSEPIVTKSSIFIPYKQEENTIEALNKVLFQRTIKNQPVISSHVEAISDADSQTSTNIHNISYKLSSNDDDSDLISPKFTHITPSVYDKVTPSSFLTENAENRKDIDTVKENIYDHPQRPLEIIHDKIDYTSQKNELFQGDKLKVILDSSENTNTIPFHGSLALGSSHLYEFEGMAKEKLKEENIMRILQNKEEPSNTNDDQSHFYGLSLLQPSVYPIITNKTEITESEAKIKISNISNGDATPIIHLNEKFPILSDELKFNATVKDNQFNKKDEKLLKRIAKSDIPDSGVIGDDLDEAQTSDDILKILSNINNKTDTNDTKEDIIKDVTSQIVTLKNFKENISDLVTVSSPILNQTKSENTTSLPLRVFSIYNDSIGQKKGYPLSRPIAPQSSGVSVVSTIVAVILAAFVIIGMAVIAVVAIIAKNYGPTVVENKVITAPPLKKMVSPTTSPRSSKEHSPRRTPRLNR